MTKADELNALADRCEREEPSVRLRHDIAKTLGWTWVQFGYVQWRNPSGRDASVPNWCESLDAAVTLVPENHTWSVGDALTAVKKAQCERLGRFSQSRPTQGKTPALALCAAALRARASLLPAKEGQ